MDGVLVTLVIHGLADSTRRYSASVLYLLRADRFKPLK